MAVTRRDLIERVDLARTALESLTKLVPRETFRDPPELSEEEAERAYELALAVADLALDDQWPLEPIGQGSPVYTLPDETRQFLALIPALQSDLAALCGHLEPRAEAGSAASLSIRHCRPTRDLVLHLVRGHSEKGYTAEALEWEIFQPDQWWSNAYSFGLRPALVGVDVPLRLHRRLVEIHRCILSANWFAAIALARSTLETSLRDVLNLPKGELKDLIPSAGELFGREFSGLAEKIRKWGNESLHPTTDDDLFLRDGSFARNRVQEVVDALIRIIERLYPATPLPATDDH